jgi:hypothetical protein
LRREGKVGQERAKFDIWTEEEEKVTMDCHTEKGRK